MVEAGMCVRAPATSSIMHALSESATTVAEGGEVGVTIEASGSPGDARLLELLEQHRRRVRAVIFSRCPRGRGLSPEDIEQEVWIAISGALRRGTTIEHPIAYVCRAAVSAVIRAVRRADGRHEDQFPEDADAPLDAPGPSASASPFDSATYGELRDAMAAALDQLPANRRQAVHLYLQGFTTSEIAQLLDWTEPKARNLVYRGLETLRGLLRASGYGHELL